MFPAVRAELLEFQTLGCGFFILCPGIVPVLALGALKRDDFTRHDLSPT
jgi:hypothetical protein